VTNYRWFKPFQASAASQRDAAMNITTPLVKGVGLIATIPGDSITALVRKIGDFTGLFNEDSGLGLVLSGLAGTAAALAVALALTVYFHTGNRTVRDVVKHGIAVAVALILFAFVISDMRHAALAYLGFNPSSPAVEFEIRLPKADVATVSDTQGELQAEPQVELHTDRNQQLAELEGVIDASAGQSVLRGVVTLDYRTTDRVVVLNLPGRAQCEFKLRLAADPSRSEQFGPWHLADRVTLSAHGQPTAAGAHDAFAIRYRVL
jgi:hypothetical protein